MIDWFNNMDKFKALYYFYFYDMLEKAQTIVWRWGRGLTLKGPKVTFIFEIMAMEYVLIMLTVTQYIFQKSTNCPIKMMNFVECKLYFNRPNYEYINK